MNRVLELLIDNDQAELNRWIAEAKEANQLTEPEARLAIQLEYWFTLWYEGTQTLNSFAGQLISCFIQFGLAHVDWMDLARHYLTKAKEQ